MAAGNNPTIADPKVLFQGALSTTLTTTLVTAPAEAGVRITTLYVINTGSTRRLVTFDYFKATTGRKLANAYPLIPDGIGVDLLSLITQQQLIIDASDLIRGGQDAGTDVDCIICGYELKE
jgi:hypothetical protein